VLVAGAVDDAHAAGADLLQDAVVGEPPADHRVFTEAVALGGAPFGRDCTRRRPRGEAA
jgi:hypothetical protein